MRYNDGKPKVILIGLDGATWDLIKPWSDEGKLPTFKYLMEYGVWGILESTIPPQSPCAWTSIYTGCMPSKHRIFGFVKRKKDSYFYRPISSKDIKVPTVWEILSNFNKRSIIINALFFYPPKKINGIIITGLGTPSKKSNFVYPESYKNFILKNFPKYDIDFNEELLLVSSNAYKFIRKIEEVTNEQIRLTKYFIKNEEWDFIFSIFRALDVIQHYFWNDKNLVFKFYKMLDNFISWILNKLSEESYNLFIVSDHGFAPVNKYFCVNNWLKQIHMLEINKTLVQSSFVETIKKILLRFGTRSLVWYIKNSSLLEKILKFLPSEYSYIHQINWDKTKAYYYEGSGGIICINLKGREPAGIVPREEYDNTVNYIIQKLEKVVDPETKERIIERIYTKKELYRTNDETLPDIFILMRRGYQAVSYNKIDDNSLFMPPLSGRIIKSADHHINGVFIAYGWNIANKKLESKVKLWDIMPTILHILQVPIPPYVDGHVLKDIFKEELSLVKVKESMYHSTNNNEKEIIRKKIKELKIHRKI